MVDSSSASIETERESEGLEIIEPLEALEGVTISDFQGGGGMIHGSGGALYELTNETTSLDEATTIITTIAESDLTSATSLEAALGSNNAIVIAAAPPDASLPDGAQVIQPANIVFAPVASADVNDLPTAVIYNGEVVTTTTSEGIGATSFFELV